MAKDQEPSGKKEQPKQYNSYLKFSGLAVQLVATIGLAGWLGYLLDNYLALGFPLFIIVFTLLAFSGAMFQLYKSMNKF